VDVRTGADNRSAAVALQLEKLGAQVEKKLTKNLTHVVFKDGRKNTLEIALKRKLKLVTVLWVDR
jgi:microcephalin